MFVGLVRGLLTFAGALLPVQCWSLVWDGVSGALIMQFSARLHPETSPQPTKDEWKPPRQGQG